MIGPRVGVRVGNRVGLAVGIGDDPIAPMGGYPITAAQMRAAVGFGTWSTGWLCDEASGNLVPSFGSPTLTAGGSPVYGIPGPRGGGDKAVGFDSIDDQFVGGAGDFDVGATDDLCIAWVGKFTGTPAANQFLFAKGAGTTRWHLLLTSALSLDFQIGSASGSMTSFIDVTSIVGSWHAGIIVLDRSTSRFRHAVQILSSGAALVAAERTAFVETSSNADPFTVGNRAAASPALNWQCAAIYAGAGAGAANGMSANLGTALSNFVATVRP